MASGLERLRWHSKLETPKGRAVVKGDTLKAVAWNFNQWYIGIGWLLKLFVSVKQRISTQALKSLTAVKEQLQGTRGKMKEFQQKYDSAADAEANETEMGTILVKGSMEQRERNQRELLMKDAMQSFGFHTLWRALVMIIALVIMATFANEFAHLDETDGQQGDII